MTYDFIIMARRDKAFFTQLQDAMASASDCEVLTDIHKLRFQPGKQVVTVGPHSETRTFCHKVIPTEIAYQTLQKMIDGDWDSISL